ncbi:hypothetical protein AHF37_08924 [Paragonimus kellicotti]|nr:hypothetical protein AHF37_08924 [Paragonimus kellicotti]
MTEPNEADREAGQHGGGFVMPEVSFLSYFFHVSPVRLRSATDWMTGSVCPVRAELSTHLGPAGHYSVIWVENLRYVADERSILLLWSPPINSNLPPHTTSFSLPEVDHYVVKWGKVYPGPATMQVTADQTRFLLNNLGK